MSNNDWKLLHVAKSYIIKQKNLLQKSIMFFPMSTIRSNKMKPNTGLNAAIIESIHYVHLK